MVDWNGNGKRDVQDKATDFYIFNKTNGEKHCSKRSNGGGCLTVFVIVVSLALMSGLF